MKSKKVMNNTGARMFYIQSPLRGKKGMLLVSETLKMVIAIISIGFLIYLLAAMYYSGTEEKERQDATSLINRIENITFELEEGNFGEINGLVPADWVIVSYTGAEQSPNECSGVNCLCICKASYVKSRVNECSNDGICFIAEELYPNPEIEIKNGGATDIEIYREGGRLKVKEI